MLVFQITGGSEAVQALQRLAEDLPARFAGALVREGERIMARSKQEFVPVDTGALKASGHVVPPTTHPDLAVELVYGGPSVPYAVTQHETPWFVHPVGQWKYLEQPLMDAVDGMPERLAGDMQF